MTRRDSVFAAIGVVLGVLLTAGLGVYSFVTLTTTTLYRSVQDVPSSGHAPSPPQWTHAVGRARDLTRAGIVEKNLPGVSVAVGVGGDIVWAEGFGWADLAKRVPVTPSTRFRIGHASKALTSAGVGLLLERNTLRLNDEIQNYVPSFPRKPWPITLRQLMGHVAGVRHYDEDDDYIPREHCERASEGLRMFANDPLLFEPETQFKYSTFGWVLVSAAVESAAGVPFFPFMRTEIFTPIGMIDTTPDIGSAPMPNRAIFYYPKFSGDPSTGPEVPESGDYSCFAGAGGFLSTPSDLVRFGIAMGSGKLLRPATVNTLHTPQLLRSGAETEYGLGWTLQTVELAGQPTRMASHASLTLLGSSTSFLTFPDRSLVVAMTSNVSRASMRAIALNIAEAFAAR